MKALKSKLGHQIASEIQKWWVKTPLTV